MTRPPHLCTQAEGSIDLARGFVNVGDTDGDGRSDIAMSECGFDTFGRFQPSGVWLFTANPWRILKSWRRKVETFGSFIAPVGDVDGDGKADIAVVNDFNPPAVEVLSLASETSLWRVEFPFEFGDVEDFIAIGDLDGAGCEELALSLWTGERQGWMQCVLRGEDGTSLWSHIAPPGSTIGLGVSHRAGDVDGDGAPDFWSLRGHADENLGTIELRSGRDGNLLRGVSCWVASSRTVPHRLLTSTGMARTNSPRSGTSDAGHHGLVEVISSRSLEVLVQFHCESARSIAALRTPHGARIVVILGSLQAFDLVPKEGVGSVDAG